MGINVAIEVGIYVCAGKNGFYKGVLFRVKYMTIIYILYLTP